MLERFREKLRHRPLGQMQPLGDESLPEAAVLVALTRVEDPAVVLIKRAERLNNHSGQVAFPGGMWEPEDASLLHTALRESEEEIALPPEDVEIVAALEPQVTRFDVRVSPFLGFIPAGIDYVPELAELDAVFEVPLSYLLEPANYRRMQIAAAGGLYDAPCIFYGEYCIWGFTFRVLCDVLENVFDTHLMLDREVRAIEERLP